MGEKVVKLNFSPFLCFYESPSTELPAHPLFQVYDAVADTHLRYHGFLEGPPKKSLLVPLKDALRERDKLLAQLQKATKVEVLTSSGAWFFHE